MGIYFCCVTRSLVPSNWIQIAGIIVNACLAIWIVCTIQKNINNKRVLKDHFIDEIKSIRNDYRKFLSDLYTSHINPQNALSWFKLMSIKIDDLMSLIGPRYNVDERLLNPYQNELRKIITENKDFIDQFKADKGINFSNDSKKEFIMFQQNFNHLFNEIIIKINDNG
jgi:hypothetical protein